MWRPQLMMMIILVLGLQSVSCLPVEQLRQLQEPNRVVLELPSINFTRLYNEVSLGRLYSRLFNVTRGKPTTEEVPIVKQHPLPNDDYQYVYTAGGVASDAPASALPTPSSPYSEKSSLRQLPLGLSGFRLMPGPAYGYGARPGYGYVFPNYAQLYGANNYNYNNIPGLTVQQLSPFVGYNGFGGLYNYVTFNNNGRRQGGGGIGGINGNLFASHQQFESFGGDSFDYGDEEQQDIDSYADDYGDDGNIADYGNDDEFYDDDGTAGDELWRKANSDKTAKKQHKTKLAKAKRTRKLKQQLQNQQQQTQRRRFSY